MGMKLGAVVRGAQISCSKVGKVASADARLAPRPSRGAAMGFIDEAGWGNVEFLSTSSKTRTGVAL